MIDVVFQLVIFFMVTSTFMMTPGIDLLFPASTTSEPVVMSSFVVTVASPDEIYINRDQYSLSTFGDALAGIDEQERAEIDSVIIEGDRSVSYDLLIKILDRLRLYGFKSISLRTLEDTTSQTP